MKNNKQLDLNICKDTKIELLLPCFINEYGELFKYNFSSEYYNDICFTYTTENGSDILLSDRKSEYFDNKMSLCKNNCEFGGYKSNITKSLCECEFKTNFSKISEITKENLLNTFLNIDDKTNFKVMKCFMKLFTPDGLAKNIGTYIFFLIIICNLLCVILFIKKGKSLLYKQIEIKADNNHKINLTLNINQRINFKKKKKKKIKKKIKIVKNAPQKEDKGRNVFDNNKTNIENGSKKSCSKVEIMNNNNFIINNNETNGDNIYNDIKNKLNDQEINSLPYKEALKLDKRTYIGYYI